jgi:type I restriction enzyme S subunit
MARELNSSEIPDGWSYGLLDNYAERCSGHTPSKSFPEYWDGGIKWISLADSFRLDKGLVEETDKEISKLGTENSSAQVHPAGTVVLSRDAGIGKSGVMAEPMAVSQHFIAWKCDINDKIHNWFLYNWLQLNKHEFERQAVGSTIKTIGLPYFKKLKIALPPYPEQRKIAKILSTWDKAISTTEKLIETSKQQKKALMQQLLTGKKRLVNPETGKIFEGEWDRFSMSDLVLIDRKSLGKKTPDDFEFQYISLSDVDVGSISKELEVHKFAGAPSRARRVIQEGDILLSTVRPNLKGFAKVSENHTDCIASTGFCVLTPKKRVSGDYIYQYIFSSHVTGQIDSLVVGSNYPAINSSDVAGLKVYCPTYEEQQRIASLLTAADKEIEVLEAKLAHFKQEKKALMQQLLTGKRRVKVDEDVAV